MTNNNFQSSINNSIGLMGGVFDPIHYGHLIIAQAALEKFNLKEVIFIPSGNPPHKQNIKITAKNLRTEMVSLAIRNNLKFKLSRCEIFRDGLSYSFDTILEFKKIYAGSEIYFITGIDALQEILTWHKSEKLKGICYFVAATRPNFNENKLAEILDKEFLQWIKLLPTAAINISATEIREKIKNNQSIKYLVPEKVEQFIYNHNLYK